VTVSSVEIQTTTNLVSALRHLRKSNESRLIWTDALCINQGDSKEKTHQVKLMSDIYRTAHRCLLWLGDFESLDLEEQEGDEFVKFFEG
jgi:Heterokaryon incompatibility protein (HET)